MRHETARREPALRGKHGAGRPRPACPALPGSGVRGECVMKAPRQKQTETLSPAGRATKTQSGREGREGRASIGMLGLTWWLGGVQVAVMAVEVQSVALWRGRHCGRSTDTPAGQGPRCFPVLAAGLTRSPGLGGAPAAGNQPRAAHGWRHPGAGLRDPAGPYTLIGVEVIDGSV